MDILDMPIEIIDLIMIQLVLDDFNSIDLLQVRLVNKLFSNRIIQAVFTTRKFPKINRWMPYAADYLYVRVMAADFTDYYPIYIVRCTIDWLLNYLSADQEMLPRKKQNIARAVCQMAANNPSQEMCKVLTESYGYELLKSKREISSPSDILTHCLPAAASIGDVSLMASLLLQHNVDINIPSNVFGTALRNAAHIRNIELVSFILSQGADASSGMQEYTKEEEEQALQDPYNTHILLDIILPRQDRFATSALGAAAAQGHEEIFKLLLQSISPASLPIFDLYKTITYAAIGGNPRILSQILQITPLHTLPDKFRTEVLAHALKAAAYYNRVHTIELLLKHGAPINHQGNLRSALWHATSCNNIQAMEVLLQNGACVDDQLRFLETPIIVAIEKKFLRAVEVLLDYGATVFYMHARVLKYVILQRNTEILTLLLDRGVHKRYEDAGVNALSLARSCGYHDYVAMLEKYGVRD